MWVLALTPVHHIGAEAPVGVALGLADEVSLWVHRASRVSGNAKHLLSDVLTDEGMNAHAEARVLLEDSLEKLLLPGENKAFLDRNDGNLGGLRSSATDAAVHVTALAHEPLVTVNELVWVDAATVCVGRGLAFAELLVLEGTLSMGRVVGLREKAFI